MKTIFKIHFYHSGEYFTELQSLINLYYDIPNKIITNVMLLVERSVDN